MINSRLKFIIFNILGLQITWGACAYGATHEFPMLGVIVGVAYIVLHFIFVVERQRDLYVLISIGLLGVLLDFINTQLNLVSFAIQENSYLILPYWLIVLWMVFSLMVPHSLYWLKQNMLVASLAGAIGGSLSYWMGHKLGALAFPEPTSISFLIYFIQWGIFFPVALYIVQIISNIGRSRLQIEIE